MNFEYIIVQIITGLVIGFAIGLTGIGAAVLILPALIFISKVDPVTAVGTSMFYALITKSYGVYEHMKLGNVRKRTALYFLIGSIPSILAASVFINYLNLIIEKSVFDYWMQTGISIFLVFLCILLLYESSKYVWKMKISHYVPQEVFSLKRKLRGIFFGVIVGFVIGTTSIGGGILIIPILTSVFSLSAKNTVGTSIVISVGLTLVGSAVYIFYGNINFAVAFLLFLGSLPGVWLGSRMTVHIKPAYLSFTITIIAIISTLLMFKGIKH